MRERERGKKEGQTNRESVTASDLLLELIQVTIQLTVLIVCSFGSLSFKSLQTGQDSVEMDQQLSEVLLPFHVCFVTLTL